MITTVLNPTLWLLAAITVSALAAGFRGETAGRALARVVTVATRVPVLALLGLMATGGLASRAVLGYLSPGSYAEEVLAARSFLDQRQLYRGDDRRDFSRWLSEDPAPVAPWTLPGLTVCEASAVGSRPEFYTSQGHSPVLLLSSVPVVALGGGRALYWVFVLLSLGSLVVVGAALVRTAGLTIGSPPAMLLMAALAGWQPSLAGIRQGDAVILVAGLIVVAWALQREDQPSRSGLASGLAGVLLVPTLVMLVPVGLYSRRALGVGVATLLVVLGATVAIAGPLIVVDYVRSTAASAALYDAAPMAYSAAGQLLRLPTGGVSAMIWAGAVSVGLSLAAVLVSWSRQRGRTGTTGPLGSLPLDLALALFVALGFLLMPVAWSQHVTLLVLPIGVMLARVVARNRPFALAALASIVALLSLPDQAVGRLGLALHLSGGAAGVTGLPPLPVWAALGLWGWVLFEHVRSPAIERAG